MSNSTSKKQKLFKAAIAASLVTGALVMVAPANADAATAKIKDLNPSSVYYQSVIELESRGVIDGFKDGTFKPYSPVTRGQAAKIIANALRLDTVNVKNPGFKDVKPNNQFYGPISALIEEGIITGFKDDTYRPGDTLTRSQMAKIISLAFDLPEEKSSANNFTDVNNSSWYKGYVQTLVKFNVTKGTTAKLFSPNEAVDRGQIATFVVRAEKAISGNQFLYNALFDEIKAGNTDEAVSFGMSGKKIVITINKSDSQFTDFEIEAANVLKKFKENHKTVVETATVSYNSSIGTVTIPIENANNKLQFDELIVKALNKVGLSKTTKLSILEGRTIGLKVKGTIDGKAFNDEYSFKFEAKK